MNATVLHSIWTVIAFVFFVAVVLWAWSGRRKKDFDEAARMALDDDKSVSDDQLRDK
jgi:cytochrome c oxidase cbb3-type subunit 4